MEPDLVDSPRGLDDLIAHDAQLLSAQLTSIRQRLFPPAAQKTLRPFSSGEAAALIGISDAYLRQLSWPVTHRNQGRTSPAAASTRSRRSTTFAEHSKAPKAVNMCLVVWVVNICRSSRSPISKAAQARQRLPPICHSTSHSADTVSSRLTWTLSPAFPRSSGINQKPMWEKTKLSTAPYDMMTAASLCGTWSGKPTSLD